MGNGCLEGQRLREALHLVTSRAGVPQSSYAATYKHGSLWWGGGWAATLKSAMRRGLPVCGQDTAYRGYWLYYVGALVVGLQVPADLAYHDAVRAHCRQMAC
jgi:hypothetical protein